jgi:uncharacterized protein involved in exopolysaccharide biosynthesis
MRIDIHYHADPATICLLKEVLQAVSTLDEKVNRIMATEQEITDLVTQAAALVSETLATVTHTDETVVKINADLDRIIASLPTDGGLDEAATNRVRDIALGLRDQVSGLRDRVSALSAAATAVDDRTPEPTPPAEPETPPPAA